MSPQQFGLLLIAGSQEWARFLRDYNHSCRHSRLGCQMLPSSCESRPCLLGRHQGTLPKSLCMPENQGLPGQCGVTNITRYQQKWLQVIEKSLWPLAHQGVHRENQRTPPLLCHICTILPPPPPGGISTPLREVSGRRESLPTSSVALADTWP